MRGQPSPSSGAGPAGPTTCRSTHPEPDPTQCPVSRGKTEPPQRDSSPGNKRRHPPRPKEDPGHHTSATVPRRRAACGPEEKAGLRGQESPSNTRRSDAGHPPPPRLSSRPETQTDARRPAVTVQTWTSTAGAPRAQAKPGGEPGPPPPGTWWPQLYFPQLKQARAPCGGLTLEGPPSRHLWVSPRAPGPRGLGTCTLGLSSTHTLGPQAVRAPGLWQGTSPPLIVGGVLRAVEPTQEVASRHQGPRYPW